MGVGVGGVGGVGGGGRGGVENKRHTVCFLSRLAVLFTTANKKAALFLVALTAKCHKIIMIIKKLPSDTLSK